MSAHSFQVLQVAAGNADIEMETLTRGIYEMQKSLAAGGTAEESIRSLGLSFTQLKTMAPEKQFATISEALSHVTDQNERVKITADLFGKSGLELKRLFDGGGEAIDDAVNQLARMGEVTESDVKAIGVWDSAWKELKGTIDAIWNQLAVALAPAITEMIDLFTEFFQSAEVKEYLTMAFKNLGVVIRWVVNSIRPLLDMLKSFLNLLATLYRYAVNLYEFVFGATQETVDAAKIIADSQNNQAPLFLNPPDEKIAKDTKGQRDALADDAKHLIDSLRTPFEVIEDKIKHFRMLADLGYIGEGDFDKLVKREIDNAKPTQTSFSNPAMVAGSQAAIQFLANQKYGDPQKATWDAMRKALDKIAQNTKPKPEAGPAVVPAF
jgi:hypothetical protein